MSDDGPDRIFPRIGIVACGAIVRELTAIAQRQGWDYALTGIPAQLHNRPERIAPAVADILETWAGRFDLILVGYADCGTRGDLDQLMLRYPHVVRIPGPHCYEFYGGESFGHATAAEPGTFFLTDFLARHFDGLVWRGLGLDRFPELAADYFAHYRQVLYLRQTVDPILGADYLGYARAAAERLGLPLRVVDTGLGCLEVRLINLIAQWRAGTVPNPDAWELPQLERACATELNPGLPDTDPSL